MMLIDGKEYLSSATKDKITIADSFVVKSNKLGSGNGEAKLYVGNEGPEVRNFFGQEGFKIKCFFLKHDLIKFMEDLRYEYKKPVLPYNQRDDLPSLYDARLLKLKSLPEIVWFDLNEQVQIDPPRIYVKSTENNYQLLRELPLPNLGYLSIMKLASEDGALIYYCKLFIDYIGSFGTTSHPSEEDEVETDILKNSSLSEEEKLQTRIARVGQGKYRKLLLDECPFCPFTLVSDDRLLIASHIKPWSKSNASEKIDPKNGFMFTPTFDYLFDQGFITFKDNREMLVSPWLSTPTISKLSLNAYKVVKFLPIDGRQKYLEYHRSEIFKS